MTREQRIAIARVVSDMIKADNIIEETEIKDMKRLMSDYSLTHQDMTDARNIKFSDAVPVLRELTPKDRKEFVTKILTKKGIDAPVLESNVTPVNDFPR